MTKQGGAGLDPSIILDMISMAKPMSEQLINKLDSEIAVAEATEELWLITFFDWFSSLLPLSLVF